jgi:serine/threonine-protein kinase RsbW
MQEVELKLPPDKQHVGLARLVVVSAARRCGMDEERVEDLRIAVSEATTNAILAHQREDSPDRITLRFGATEDGEFQVTISDTGPGFDPKTAEELEARDWSIEGGLGVTLIRGLADHVEFVREAGMRVQLRFGVALPGADGPKPDELDEDLSPGRLGH